MSICSLFLRLLYHTAIEDPSATVVMTGSEHRYRGGGRGGGRFTYLYRDTRREHHPGALRACGLPSRWRPRRLARPSRRRPRTRYLPRATRPHSRNPQLRGWTIPANLPIARSTEVPVLPARMPRYPRFGFSREPVSWRRARFSRRLSSWRRPSFSLLPFSRRPSSPVSPYALS